MLSPTERCPRSTVITNVKYVFRPLGFALRPSPNSAIGGRCDIIAEDGAPAQGASRRKVPLAPPKLGPAPFLFPHRLFVRRAFYELSSPPPPSPGSGNREESRKTGQSLKASQHDVTLALTAPPSSLGRLRRIRRTTRSKLVFRGRLRNVARSPPLRTRRPPFYGTGNPKEFLSSLPHRPKARRTYALALRSGFRLRGVQS